MKEPSELLLAFRDATASERAEMVGIVCAFYPSLVETELRRAGPAQREEVSL